MRTIQGEFGEHFHVHEHLTVQGGAAAGAHVHPGGRLVIQGALAGPLVLEEGAVVSVEGAYAGDLLRNDGVLIISGVIGTDIGELEGEVRVRIGSAVMRDGNAFVLADDGSLVPHRRGDSLEMRGTPTFLNWLSNDGLFAP